MRRIIPIVSIDFALMFNWPGRCRHTVITKIGPRRTRIAEVIETWSAKRTDQYRYYSMFPLFCPLGDAGGRIRQQFFCYADSRGMLIVDRAYQRHQICIVACGEFYNAVTHENGEIKRTQVLGMTDNEGAGQLYCSSFDSLPPNIQRLLADSESASLFLTGQWFRNFDNTVRSSSQPLYLFSCETNGGGQGLLPMWAPGSSGIGRGRSIQSLTNYYTTHFAPLISTDASQVTVTIKALVSSLCQSRPNWDSINIQALDPASIEWIALEESFVESGWIVCPYFSHGNWFLDTSDMSFEEYLASRGSSIRKSIANRERKFDRLDDSSFRIATTSEEMVSAANEFLTLSRLRWGREEPFPEFLPELIRLCAENQWLRLGVATIGGVPAAAQLWIVRNGVAYIYKVAYDDAFKSLSVGAVLTLKMMRYVMDTDNVREVDYLTGDDAYKKSWMGGRRERWGMMLYNANTIRGWVYGRVNQGKRVLKDLYGQIRHSS